MKIKSLLVTSCWLLVKNLILDDDQKARSLDGCFDSMLDVGRSMFDVHTE